MPNSTDRLRPKILLAEDDPGVRRSLQLLLQGRGYNVRSYTSGRALLADPTAVEAVCFVADFCMPDLDGLAILRDLRSRGWDRPAIMVTAFHSPDLAEQALAEGFSVVIEKPLLDHVLTDTLARLVQ